MKKVLGKTALILTSVFAVTFAAYITNADMKLVEKICCGRPKAVSSLRCVSPPMPGISVRRSQAASASGPVSGQAPETGGVGVKASERSR